MKNSEELKNIVKEKYGEIASKAPKEESCSCCCSSVEMDYTVFSNDYTKLEGYNPDADMGLGCGLPTQYAGIKEADRVLDLGSGAGNDCFVARRITGDKGKVTGIDFTQEMIDKANENVKKTGFENINFVLGDIENMPLENNTFDVVISNCVLNLVPDKLKAFVEIHRVLDNGGHFCISDIVLKGELPDNLKNAAEAYAGCVSGAVQKEEYLEIIKNASFSNIEIKKDKHIVLGDHILNQFLTEKEIEEYRNSNTGIHSITVVAKK